MSQSVAALSALVFCCALVTVGAQSDSVQVSRSGRGAYEASLAAHPLGFAVAWHDTRHGVPEIYARLVDGSGRPVSDEYRLTADAGRSYEPSIDVPDPEISDDLIVAWSDEVEAGRPHEVYFQRFAANGAPDGEPRRLTDNRTASLIPAIRGAGLHFALAWNEDVVEARGDHRGGGRSEVVLTFAP